MAMKESKGGADEAGDDRSRHRHGKIKSSGHRDGSRNSSHGGNKYRKAKIYAGCARCNLYGWKRKESKRKDNDLDVEKALVEQVFHKNVSSDDDHSKDLLVKTNSQTDKVDDCPKGPDSSLSLPPNENCIAMSLPQNENRTNLRGPDENTLFYPPNVSCLQLDPLIQCSTLQPRISMNPNLVQMQNQRVPIASQNPGVAPGTHRSQHVVIRYPTNAYGPPTLPSYSQATLDKQKQSETSYYYNATEPASWHRHQHFPPRLDINQIPNFRHPLSNKSQHAQSGPNGVAQTSNPVLSKLQHQRPEVRRVTMGQTIENAVANHFLSQPSHTHNSNTYAVQNANYINQISTVVNNVQNINHPAARSYHGAPHFSASPVQSKPISERRSSAGAAQTAPHPNNRTKRYFNAARSENLQQKTNVNASSDLTQPEIPVAVDTDKYGLTIHTSEWIDDPDLAARVYIAYKLIPTYERFEKQFIDSLKNSKNANLCGEESMNIDSINNTSESIRSLLIDLTDEPNSCFASIRKINSETTVSEISNVLPKSSERQSVDMPTTTDIPPRLVDKSFDTFLSKGSDPTEVSITPIIRTIKTDKSVDLKISTTKTSCDDDLIEKNLSCKNIGKPIEYSDMSNTSNIPLNTVEKSTDKNCLALTRTPAALSSSVALDCEDPPAVKPVTVLHNNSPLVLCSGTKAVPLGAVGRKLNRKNSGDEVDPKKRSLSQKKILGNIERSNCGSIKGSYDVTGSMDGSNESMTLYSEKGSCNMKSPGLINKTYILQTDEICVEKLNHPDVSKQQVIVTIDSEGDSDIHPKPASSTSSQKKRRTICHQGPVTKKNKVKHSSFNNDKWGYLFHKETYLNKLFDDKEVILKQSSLKNDTNKKCKGRKKSKTDISPKITENDPSKENVVTNGQNIDIIRDDCKTDSIDGNKRLTDHCVVLHSALIKATENESILTNISTINNDIPPVRTSDSCRVNRLVEIDMFRNNRYHQVRKNKFSLNISLKKYKIKSCYVKLQRISPSVVNKYLCEGGEKKVPDSDGYSILNSNCMKESHPVHDASLPVSQNDEIIRDKIDASSDASTKTEMIDNDVQIISKPFTEEISKDKDEPIDNAASIPPVNIELSVDPVVSNTIESVINKHDSCVSDLNSSDKSSSHKISKGWRVDETKRVDPACTKFKIKRRKSCGDRLNSTESNHRIDNVSLDHIKDRLKIKLKIGDTQPIVLNTVDQNGNGENLSKTPVNKKELLKIDVVDVEESSERGIDKKCEVIKVCKENPSGNTGENHTPQSPLSPPWKDSNSLRPNLSTNSNIGCIAHARSLISSHKITYTELKRRRSSLGTNTHENKDNKSIIKVNATDKPVDNPSITSHVTDGNITKVSNDSSVKKRSPSQTKVNDKETDPRLRNVIYCGCDSRHLKSLKFSDTFELSSRQTINLKKVHFESYGCFNCEEKCTSYETWTNHSCV